MLAADWDTHAFETTVLYAFPFSLQKDREWPTLGSMLSGSPTPDGCARRPCLAPPPRSESVLLDGVMDARGHDAEAEERRVEPMEDSCHR